MTEEWRPIDGYDGMYEVSNLGRVRSWKGGYPSPKVLRQAKHEGYAVVSFWHNGRGKTHRAHVLVAKAFLPPRPSASHVVRHLDGDQDNNTVGNLAWGTQRENSADMIRHGRSRRGEKQHNSKLTASQVLAIYERHSAGEGTNALAEEFGVAVPTVSHIVTGRSWAWLTGASSREHNLKLEQQT